MNVKQINELLSVGEIDREDMWPRLVEYESKMIPFPFKFGLDELPKEPGLILVRGARQFGKSTWLDQELRWSIQEHGKGSAFYLNGDELRDDDELYDQLIGLSSSFSKDAPLRRIFIDEITAVPEWERAIKRAYDQGPLRQILVITTGSKAMDLRRGKERLPGRRGKLARSEYLFLPISYRMFYESIDRGLRDKAWIAYLLAGGSPLGCNEICQFERLPEHFIDLQRDWIYGEIISSGRSRMALISLLRLIYKHGGTPVGFAKLAREAGLANNTVASGYIECLSDLLCVVPAWPLDVTRRTPLLRRPCKFHFINLAGAGAFNPLAYRHVHEFENSPPAQQAILLEWLVAQELWRRSSYLGSESPEALYYISTREHEIDFCSSEHGFIEVKRGKASALDFSWFPQQFPKERLTVICSTPFETASVRGVTLHDFLYCDGLPAPYPGQDDQVYTLDNRPASSS